MEEKRKIIETFLESGLTASAASKLPGWPSRYTLRKWMKKVEQGLLVVRMPERPEHHKHKRFDPKIKREALRLLRAGLDTRAIATRLNLGAGQRVRVWEKAVREGRLDPKTGRTIRKPKEMGSMSSERERELENEIAELKLEKSVLMEVVRDPKVLGLESLSNRQKTEYVERLRRACALSLTQILRLLNFSKSSYYYARKRKQEEDEAGNRPINILVREAFDESKNTYGYRRIYAYLKQRGYVFSEKRIRASMRAQGLTPRSTRRKRTWSSYLGELSSAPGNLCLSDKGRHSFSAVQPNTLWFADITEMKTSHSTRCYLSCIIDAYDQAVVGWDLSTSPDATLANNSLIAACSKLTTDQAPIIHSDRGAHYRWRAWMDICSRHGLTRSMSRKGRCSDNAAVEGFFGRLKTEFFNDRDWTSITYDEFKRRLSDYIDWYNNHRIREKSNWKSPNAQRREQGFATV